MYLDSRTSNEIGLRLSRQFAKMLKRGTKLPPPTKKFLSERHLVADLQAKSSTMRACGFLPPPPHTKNHTTEVHGKCEKIRGNVHPTHLIYNAWMQYDENWEDKDQCCLTQEQREDEIAEAIFDWWISGKPYKQWYADKYIHLKFYFGEDENETTH